MLMQKVIDLIVPLAYFTELINPLINFTDLRDPLTALINDNDNDNILFDHRHTNWNNNVQ